jgi:GNAT superfamily N-acetyltransferase
MTSTHTVYTVYTVAPAERSDVPALPGIELAAARLLAGHAPEPLLRVATSVADLEASQAAGRLWVARAGDAAVGFAHVTLREPGAAHLEELDVHPAHGRRGLGRRLVLAVCEWAARQGYEAVTLTTFRDVPFNMPFYRTMGFVVLEPGELSPAVAAVLEAEARAGLARERRVAMRRASSTTPSTTSDVQNEVVSDVSARVR